MPLSETKEIASAEVVQGRPWIGWLPIAVLPLVAVAFRNLLPAWVFMWILSFAIFISLKWLTWWRARARMVPADLALHRLSSRLAGNGCRGFFGCEPARSGGLRRRAWLWATLETALGAILLWVVARSLPQGEPLLAGGWECSV